MDLKEIYASRADEYQQLISREDFHENIPSAIRSIRPVLGLDLIDLGAGTGRLAVLLAAEARSVRAYDASAAMLQVARQRLADSGLENWEVEVAEHHAIPADDQSADMLLAGWSLVYAAIWAEGAWQDGLQRALDEIQRVLRPGGTIIVLETMGTGVREPQPPEDLLAYFAYLDESGFESSWIRTDYRFNDQAEAERLAGFFFGQEMLDRIVEEDGQVVLPECTGVWWKHLPGGQAEAAHEGQ